MDKSPLTTNAATPDTSADSVKASVFQRIEDQYICPRSRIFFQSRECAAWSAWLLSVIIGSLALAVIFYVAVNLHYAPYEATHQNWLTFIFSALPYVWLIVFGVMVYLAATEFRYTKRGYRYRTVQVVGSSILLSVVGGLALHGAGLGYAIDDILGQKMDMYMSMEKSEIQRWQQPESGRLLGRVQLSSSVTSPAATVIFIDYHQKRWSLVVDELNREEMALLQTDDMIRLLGMVEQGAVFYACAALPWQYNRYVSHADFVAARNRFTERMLAHKNNNQARRDSFDNEAGVDTTVRRCPDMPAVQKM